MSTITLETIAAPGATPIAVNGASAQSFANDYWKLGPDGVSASRDRKTISILGLIYELNTVRGINYKAAHKNLIQDSTVWTKGLSMFDIVRAMAAVDWSNGKAADATLSNSIPALLNEGRDFAQLSDDELDRIIAFLNAQLLE